jgi:hypothetical protein
MPQKRQKVFFAFFAAFALFASSLPTLKSKLQSHQQRVEICVDTNARPACATLASDFHRFRASLTAA